MITVTLSEPLYEYDVHSLVKAFFPSQEVAVYEEGKPPKRAERAESARKAKKLKQDENAGDASDVWDAREGSPSEDHARQGDFRMQISYAPDGIGIAWQERAGGGCPADGGAGSADAGAAADGGAGGADGWRELPGRFFPADLSDRAGAKNILKRELYAMLSDYAGRTLPWGSLTGIRPTKIAMQMLEDGEEPDAIRRRMEGDYFCSEEKASLAIEIADRERRMLSEIGYEGGYSLYVGIPFCPTTCLYCSFTSYPISAWRERVGDYLDALFCEMEAAGELVRGRSPSAVYIGGGTPTTLEPEQLEKLIQKIKSCFDLTECREFSVEAGRPDSITREKLEVLRRQGVSRISVNPQTMKQATLDLIGRRHTVEQTVESYRLAREAGFDNINMDIIMGLPEETLSDVRDTMEQLRQLSPDSLTVHSLAVKRAARLGMFKEDYKIYRMVNTQEHMDLVESMAREMGMRPYYLYRQKGMAGNLENIGYSAPGKEGLYNVLIMEEKQDIFALGAGAISKRVCQDGSIRRCENVKNVDQYIGRTGEMIARKEGLFA